MEQLTEVPPSSEAKAAGAAIRPGRRPLFKREVGPPSAVEALSHVIAYLGSLQSNAETEEQRKRASLLQGLTLLQARRLRRTGRGSMEGLLQPYRSGSSPLTLLAPSRDAGETAEQGMQRYEAGGSLHEVFDLINDGDQAAQVAPARRRPVRRWETWTFLAVLLLSGVSFFPWKQTVGMWGDRVPASPGPAAATAADEGNGASDAALQTADAVTEAVGKGDLPKASALLAQAQSQGISLPGMRYQAALLALTLKDLDAADKYIDESIAAHDSIPECLYLRAAMEAIGRNYERSATTGHNYELAAAAFSEAARYTPFSPRNYFFWAECLRRNGTPAQAILQFQQALRCRPGAEDADLIRFKMRLAQLETGNDTAFQKQLAAKLVQEPVAGNTLLLGAADEINNGNQRAAAELVRKAAAVLPATIFSSRLRDFAFSSLSRVPDLAPASLPARPPPPAGRLRTLVDPATQGLQFADPANW